MEDQEFHLPTDDIVKNVPMLLRGEAKKLLAQIDNLDLNHDGKRYLAQGAKLAFALMPIAHKINDAVDFDKLAAWLVKQDFVKDEAAAKEIIIIACHAIEKV